MSSPRGNLPTPPAAAGAVAALDAALSTSDRALLRRCGIDDLGALAGRCQRLRQGLGQPAARWAAVRLVPVLREAVEVRGWPADAAGPALLAVAADPLTKSPVRLSYPGPWWDAPVHRPAALTVDERDELDTLERRLLEADGRRVWLQQRARAYLADRGEPLTRLGVARQACRLLDEIELSPC